MSVNATAFETNDSLYLARKLSSRVRIRQVACSDWERCQNPGAVRRNESIMKLQFYCIVCSNATGVSDSLNCTQTRRGKNWFIWNRLRPGTDLAPGHLRLRHRAKPRPSQRLRLSTALINSTLFTMPRNPHLSSTTTHSHPSLFTALCDDTGR